jgi:poly(A) polymerase
VRDLLLGREPKDFDVATEACPEDIRRLFRNSRLIGRRFRLAHVRFGAEVIEVATFRAAGESDADARPALALDASGRILRDNVYGTIEQDAWRSDFTVNALYYDIDDFSIRDFVGGMPDLEAGLLRLIGDPETRYREDPVRMLRAVRFAVKLGFRIVGETEALLPELATLLRDVPPARLFDEILKLFLTGSALQTFEMLRHYGLFGTLFPATEASLAREEDGFPNVLLARALANTDRRVAEGLPVTPAFLFAALLWEPVRERSADLCEAGMVEAEALQRAIVEVLANQTRRMALPRRFAVPMGEIFQLQRRFNHRYGKRALRLLGDPRFRAAFDFLDLRAQTGEVDPELVEHWRQFQANEAPIQRSEHTDQGRKRHRRRRGGRRRRRDRRATDS